MLHVKRLEHSESREWIVFIHGAGGSSSIWFKQVKAFSEHFNVLLIDLRGHGKSKNHQTDNPLYKALAKRYEAQIAEAYATLIVYFDNSVGIGEHPQILDEIVEQTKSLAEAINCLNTLSCVCKGFDDHFLIFFATILANGFAANALIEIIIKNR